MDTSVLQQSLDIATWVLLIIGGLSGIIGGIGLIRMPDFFTRCHAAGITDTLCAAAILLGLMLQTGWSLATAKLILILFFLYFTSPTATHALARAAIKSGMDPLEGSQAKGDKEEASSSNK